MPVRVSLASQPLLTQKVRNGLVNNVACGCLMSPWNAHDIIKPDVTYHKYAFHYYSSAFIYSRVAENNSDASVCLAFSNPTTPSNRKPVQYCRLQPSSSIVDRCSHSSDNGAKCDIVYALLFAVM